MWINITEKLPQLVDLVDCLIELNHVSKHYSLYKCLDRKKFDDFWQKRECISKIDFYGFAGVSTVGASDKTIAPKFGKKLSSDAIFNVVSNHFIRLTVCDSSNPNMIYLAFTNQDNRVLEISLKEDGYSLTRVFQGDCHNLVDCYPDLVKLPSIVPPYRF